MEDMEEGKLNRTKNEDKKTERKIKLTKTSFT